MAEAEFQQIVERIRRLSGIVIQEHKRTMVQARIAEHMNNLGIRTFSDYLAYLDSPNGAIEEQRFCNVLTTNLTSFFREEHHFRHFEDEIERLSRLDKSKLRIWSAGCSSGQEPYSLALLLESQKVSRKIPDIKILATDIDTDVLENAKSAVYKEEGLEKIPEYLQSSHYIHKGNSFKFSDRVRSYVTFRQLNLLERWPMKGHFDFIFCRNVVIYFSADTKARLISRFAEILRPGGILYLGHSETILGDHKLLENVGKTIYKRVPK